MRRVITPRPTGGFTIIDVLVTMAVVTVLISLLAPSLTSVRESANQVVCRSNIRQFGFGISMFAESNADLIPITRSTTMNPLTDAPWDTIRVRFGLTVGSLSGQWDGLGLLYDEDYLPAPKLYSCPSHRGRHRFSEYVAEWAGQTGEINSNYQYRGRGPTRVGHPLVIGETTRILPRIAPRGAIVADSMRSRQDFNHEIGSNILRADISVDWFADTNRTVLGLLPSEEQSPDWSQFMNAWGKFDGR